MAVSTRCKISHERENEKKFLQLNCNIHYLSTGISSSSSYWNEFWRQRLFHTDIEFRRRSIIELSECTIDLTKSLAGKVNVRRPYRIIWNDLIVSLLQTISRLTNKEDFSQQHHHGMRFTICCLQDIIPIWI